MKKNLKSLLLKFQTTRPDMTKLSSLFPHMKKKFASKTYVTFAANLKLIPTNATPRRHASRSNHPTVSQAVDASCDSAPRPARRCRSHCSAKVAIQTRTCFETASSKCLRWEAVVEFLEGLDVNMGFLGLGFVEMGEIY